MAWGCGGRSSGCAFRWRLRPLAPKRNGRHALVFRRGALFRWSLVATLLAIRPAFAEGAPGGEPRVSYDLHARLVALEPKGFDIVARGTITVDNSTPASLNELPFHLYMNAFRNEQSLARRSPFYEGRAAQSPGSNGSIDVTRLQDGRDHSPLILEFAKDDPDQTTATAVLATPIEPGARATFDVDWTVHLPALSQRTGYWQGFVFAGQWFPKLAKLARTGAWITFPFHPQAEFYANFGDYDVTLELPADKEYGATGVLLSQERSAGSATAHFRANDVHDFAWTAWEGFARHTERIGETEVTLLSPNGQTHNRDVTLNALRLGLPWFNDWLGPYPNPTLTVVHPPPHATAAGGMEYPGLITTGGDPLDGYLSAEVERVVLHELGHQWFYGTVASNEHDWPFLDEGLTSYVEKRAFTELYTSSGERALSSWAAWVQRAYSVQYGADVPIATPAAQFPSFTHLAALAYDRTALLLETFSNVYGAPFDNAFKHYARRYRGAHPSPAELITTLSEELGPDTAENLRRGLFARGHVNFAVTDLEYRRASRGKGYVNRVLLTRQGDLAFPVGVDIFERDRPPRRETWSGETTTKVLEFESDEPIEAVCLDREARVEVEDTRLDNCARTSRPKLPRHWGVVLGWLQLLLTWLAW